MAGGFYNSKDSMDISELASLNEDISDDMIEQLQQQLSEKIEKTADVKKPSALINENDDSTLFEEVQADSQTINTVSQTDSAQEQQPVGNPDNSINESVEAKEKLDVKPNFDDNFIKKYKARLQKKAQNDMISQEESSENPDENSEKKDENQENDNEQPIEKISLGKITERSLTKELKEYNDSLDFLDGNVKYSKYVIYIDPKNVNYIDSLTVKERKNLINNILRQQDEITITKKKFKIIQTIFIHILIAVLVFLGSLPIVYYAINASLEATINNHRSAQTNWQTLYKEHGKITKTQF